MMLFNRWTIVISLVLITTPVTTAASTTQNNLAEREDVLTFITEISQKHKFNENELKTLFTKVEFKQKIIDAKESGRDRIKTTEL